MANKTTEKNIIERTISGNISSNATSIRPYAFYNCTSLTSASFPNATSVGSSAFYDCTSLTSVSLPNATSIGSGAFMSSSVSDLYLDNTTQINIDLSAVPNGCKIHLGTPITSIVEPNAANTMTYVFAHSANDPVYLDMTSWPVQPSSTKITNTYYIYTDNATIKDGCLAKANEYTTINVYKLDGSSW